MAGHRRSRSDSGWLHGAQQQELAFSTPSDALLAFAPEHEDDGTLHMDVDVPAPAAAAEQPAGRRGQHRRTSSAGAALGARGSGTRNGARAQLAGDPLLGEGPSTQTRSNAFDTRLLDPKRAKRILANRQSAQRSRMKRLQHIHELEQHIEDLTRSLREQQQQVAQLAEARGLLQAATMQQQGRCAAMQQQLAQHSALHAALRSEIARLRLAAAGGPQVQSPHAAPAGVAPLGSLDLGPLPPGLLGQLGDAGLLPPPSPAGTVELHSGSGPNGLAAMLGLDSGDLEVQGGLLGSPLAMPSPGKPCTPTSACDYYLVDDVTGAAHDTLAR